jgi:hypothetical protein
MRWEDSGRGPDLPSAPTARRTANRFLVPGVILLALWILVPHFSRGGMTLEQAHGICQSGAGQLLEAFSAPASRVCGRIDLAYAGLAWCFWTGLALVGWGIGAEWMAATRKDTAP